MPVINATTKEDIIIFLEQLTKTIKESKELGHTEVLVVNETQEMPTRYSWTEELSGWVNINLKIRFLRNPKGETK